MLFHLLVAQKNVVQPTHQGTEETTRLFFWQESDEFYIMDAGSKWGTFVKIGIAGFDSVR